MLLSDFSNPGLKGDDNPSSGPCEDLSVGGGGAEVPDAQLQVEQSYFWCSVCFHTFASHGLKSMYKEVQA